MFPFAVKAASFIWAALPCIVHFKKRAPLLIEILSDLSVLFGDRAIIISSGALVFELDKKGINSSKFRCSLYAGTMIVTINKCISVIESANNVFATLISLFFISVNLQERFYIIFDQTLNLFYTDNNSTILK